MLCNCVISIQVIQLDVDIEVQKKILLELEILHKVTSFSKDCNISLK